MPSITSPSRNQLSGETSTTSPERNCDPGISFHLSIVPAAASIVSLVLCAEYLLAPYRGLPPWFGKICKQDRNQSQTVNFAAESKSRRVMKHAANQINGL